MAEFDYAKGMEAAAKILRALGIDPEHALVHKVVLTISVSEGVLVEVHHYGDSSFCEQLQTQEMLDAIADATPTVREVREGA